MSNCPFCGTTDLDNQHAFCFKCGSGLSGATGQLAPETILGDRYIITKTLGRGGMGAVYQALDKRLNYTPVAIKEMSTNALKTGDLSTAAQAFQAEATMLIKLRHPALPRVTDFFDREDGRWYLVMDYIEGETLKALVERQGKLPQYEVLDWAKQLCDILKYLHQQEPPIIFRDLKPSNIMLTKDGKIKLIDFGIARHFRPGLNADTTTFGSAGFSPPEQYGENQTDPRSDIYSFGATLHFLLTGIDPSKTPFTFEQPSHFNQISPQFEAVVMKAVEIKPKDRPESAGAVLKLLEQCQKNNFFNDETTIINTTSPKVRAPQKVTDITEKGSKKKVLLALAGGLAVVCLMAFYSFSGSEEKKFPSPKTPTVMSSVSQTSASKLTAKETTAKPPSKETLAKPVTMSQKPETPGYDLVKVKDTIKQVVFNSQEIQNEQKDYQTTHIPWALKSACYLDKSRNVIYLPMVVTSMAVKDRMGLVFHLERGTASWYPTTDKVWKPLLIRISGAVIYEPAEVAQIIGTKKDLAYLQFYIKENKKFILVNENDWIPILDEGPPFEEYLKLAGLNPGNQVYLDIK